MNNKRKQLLKIVQAKINLKSIRYNPGEANIGKVDSNIMKALHMSDSMDKLIS